MPYLLRFASVALVSTFLAAGCAAGADDTASDTSALESIGTAQFSRNATLTANAILKASAARLANAEASDDASKVMKELAATQVVAAQWAPVDTSTFAYYVKTYLPLEGKVLERQFVISEARLAGAVPSYSAKLSDEAAPANAYAVPADEVRLLQTVVDLLGKHVWEPTSPNATELVKFAQPDTVCDFAIVWDKPDGSKVFNLFGSIFEGADFHARIGKAQMQVVKLPSAPLNPDFTTTTVREIF